MRSWACSAPFMVPLGGQTPGWILAWLCPRLLGRSLDLVLWAPQVPQSRKGLLSRYTPASPGSV